MGVVSGVEWVGLDERDRDGGEIGAVDVQVWVLICRENWEKRIASAAADF